MKYEIKSYLLTITAIVLFSGQAEAGNKEMVKKPNFLVIITDDLNCRSIGYNNALVKTPSIDKLAKGGIIFNRAYTATPVCAASRASLLTGLYPQTNGTVALNTKAFVENIVTAKKFKTLPHFLNEAGYSTWFCGKSHLGDPQTYGFQFGSETMDYDDKSTFQDASGMIDEIATAKNKKPFMLWVAARQPHVPLIPEQQWLDRYESKDMPIDRNFREQPLPESFYNQGLPGENYYRDSDYTGNYKKLPAGPPRSKEIIKDFTKAYYATMSHLDYQVGKMMEQLESNGLMENTMVIFLSDNGYFLGNHGLGNKLTMHEESVRIPFFIFWDQLKEKSTSTDALISSIDIFPTMLELAGVDTPEYIQGISLNPLVSGSGKQTRNYVVSESVGVRGSLGEGHRMVVMDEWKYMLSGTGDEALFNLKSDQYELNNLIMDHPNKKVAKELKANLKQWKKITGDKKEVPK